MTSNEREPLLKMEHVSVAFPVKKDFPFQKKRYVKAATDVSLEIYPAARPAAARVRSPIVRWACSASIPARSFLTDRS